MNCCQCMVQSMVGVVAGKAGFPEEVLKIIKELEIRGANMNAHAIFTFFWEGCSDLDVWVYHKESGDHVSYTKKVNDHLKMTLDVDANASGCTTTSPIENIGTLNSDEAPDGTYELYLDNYNNRQSGNNFFNVIVAFKKEGQTQFEQVAWYRNKTSFEAPRAAGNKSGMTHVLDVIKTGRTMKLTNLTNTLEKKFVYEVDVI